jgi:hypothetical protein
MFVTGREKKGNRSDVKEYVYTGKRGLTIEPEDLKLSRKVFNHILSKHRKPSFQHINMNLDNKVAVITEKMTDKANPSTCPSNPMSISTVSLATEGSSVR